MERNRTYLGLNVGILLISCVAAFHPVAPGNSVTPHGTRTTTGRDQSSASDSTRLTSTAFDIGEWFRKTFMPQTQPPAKQTSTVTATKPVGRCCTDAVLVLGATGKTGRCVVRALLAQGRNVVVAARKKEAADDLFDKSAPGLYFQHRKKYVAFDMASGTRPFKSAPEPFPNPAPFLCCVCTPSTQYGVDVTDTSTLDDPSLFDGVSQVVSALGPRFREEGSSPESIDYVGVRSAIEAAEKYLLGNGEKSEESPSKESPSKEKLLVAPGDDDPDDGSGGPGGAWERLDDVIMGGMSSSAWKAGVGRGVLEKRSEEGMFARWAGTLIVEGGGFCGTVIKSAPFDATGFDGVRLRVRGDGNRYKFRLKPDTELDAAPERQYQASFDTVKGQWIEVDLPFESFVAVKRNYVDYSAPRVNEGAAGGKMLSLGLILSRFSFNEYGNPRCAAGAFQLDLRSISLYRSPRPAFVLVSSASAERYNRLSEEERKGDIPIVALNPGGILNWKYKAETLLRASPLTHCVVRATGLIAEGKEGDASVRLQAGQGDTLSGRISRDEVAQTIAAALGSPYAAGKTFELRRDEAEDAVGKTPDYTALFRSLVPDADRSLASASGAGLPLPPFAIALDPPLPVSEERKNEILNDPRVQAQQQAAKEGRREMEQKAAAAAATSGSSAAT